MPMNTLFKAYFTLLIAIAVSLPNVARAYNERFEYRTRVDSAAAVRMMRQHVDKLNAPLREKIATLEANAESIQKRFSVYVGNLHQVRRLQDAYVPKTKDDAVKAKFHAYFYDVVNSASRETLFSLAKEKDLQKAINDKNAGEAVNKLLAKVREQTLKQISKGNFESPFIMKVLNERAESYSSTLTDCVREKEDVQNKIGDISVKIVPSPREFTLRGFRDMLGDAEIPLKTIRVPLASLGPDYLTYAQLAERYPKCAAKAASGKFDGIIPDRVAIYPYGEACPPKFEDEGNEVFLYKQLLLKSEKGSVPDMVIDGMKPDFFEWNTIEPIAETRNGELNMTLHPLNQIWEPNGFQKTGIHMIYTTSEELGECFQGHWEWTLVVQDDRWVNKPPRSSEWISYNECREMWKGYLRKGSFRSEPVEFNYDSEHIKGTVNLLSFPIERPEIYYAGASNPMGMIFKSDSAPDLVVPYTTQWHIKRNAFGENRDALVLHYDAPISEGGPHTDYYMIEWDGPGFIYLNGHEVFSDFYWYKKSTEVYDPNTQEMVRIDFKISYDGISDWSYSAAPWYGSCLSHSAFFDEDVKTVDVLPPFIEEAKSGVSAKGYVLSQQQMEELLLGVVIDQIDSFAEEKGHYIEHESAKILSTSRLGNSWLVEYEVKARNREERSLYYAIYSQTGKVLDALYIGDIRNSIYDETTRIEWISPRRFQLSVYKISNNDSEQSPTIYHHNFDYCITDSTFLLMNVEWNVMSDSKDDGWYCDPFGFLSRFPVSHTPWELWKKLGSNADGCWNESFSYTIPFLYSRNPEASLKYIAMAIHKEDEDKESGLYNDESSGWSWADFFDYFYHGEKDEFLLNINRLTDKKARDILLKYLESQ